MAEESKAAATANTEDANEGAQAPIPAATTSVATEGGAQLTDKHGEPAINRGRYERDIAAKDSEIEQLKKKLADATGDAAKGADALKEIEQLKAQLADEKLDHSLALAGCVNAKAAKAVLADYDGDVAALKDACPYLFKQQAQTGSTGVRHQTPPDDSDEALDRAFGIKKK